jgi:hypothetical protein
LNEPDPFPLFAVAWGIWIIYLLSLRSKEKGNGIGKEKSEKGNSEQTLTEEISIP